MGRPKQHDDATRDALLAAAEKLVERGGIGALSVRVLADEIGTTTRAVYSTFGSKEGVLSALAQRSFDMLHDAIAELPQTEDPARDLVQAAITVFRPMAVEHPSLFQIAFLRAAPDVPLGPDVANAAQAGYEILGELVQRRPPARPPPRSTCAASRLRAPRRARAAARRRRSARRARCTGGDSRIQRHVLRHGGHG